MWQTRNTLLISLVNKFACIKLEWIAIVYHHLSWCTLSSNSTNRFVSFRLMHFQTIQFIECMNFLTIKPLFWGFNGWDEGNKWVCNKELGWNFKSTQFKSLQSTKTVKSFYFEMSQLCIRRWYDEVTARHLVIL